MNLKSAIFLVLSTLLSSFVNASDVNVKIMVLGPDDPSRNSALIARHLVDELNAGALSSNIGAKFDVEFLDTYNIARAKEKLTSSDGKESVLILSNSLFYRESGNATKITPLAEVARATPKFWVRSDSREISNWQQLIGSLNNVDNAPTIGLVENISVDELAIRTIVASNTIQSDIKLFETNSALLESTLAGDVDLVITSRIGELASNYNQVDANDSIISNRYVLYNHQDADQVVNDSIVSLMSKINAGENHQTFCNRFEFSCDELLSHGALEAQLKAELDDGYNLLCARGTRPCRKGCCPK